MKWGTYGKGDGQFTSPQGLAVDSQGNVFVADHEANRIQKFDSNGKFLSKLEVAELVLPFAIAVDPNGMLYVVNLNDYVSGFVAKIDPNGELIAKWNTCGKGDERINFPVGIAVDERGTIYVVDQGQNRVCIYGSDGKFISSWGSAGAGDGEFMGPSGIALDAQGDIYIPDSDYGVNGRLRKFGKR
jgi:DNA-binding beta-propeller fold protein YncE